MQINHILIRMAKIKRIWNNRNFADKSVMGTAILESYLTVCTEVEHICWYISHKWVHKRHAENVYRALFVILKNWQLSRCPPVGEWINCGLSVWSIRSTGTSTALLCSVVHGPTVSATPENLLEMQKVRLHPRYTESTPVFLCDSRWFLMLNKVWAALLSHCSGSWNRSWTSSISITWELVRNANSQAPCPELLTPNALGWDSTICLNSPPGDWMQTEVWESALDF